MDPNRGSNASLSRFDTPSPSSSGQRRSPIAPPCTYSLPPPFSFRYDNVVVFVMINAEVGRDCFDLGTLLPVTIGLRILFRSWLACTFKSSQYFIAGTSDSLIRKSPLPSLPILTRGAEAIPATVCIPSSLFFTRQNKSWDPSYRFDPPS